MKLLLPLMLFIGVLILSCNQPKKEIVETQKSEAVEEAMEEATHEVVADPPKEYTYGIDISHYKGDEVDFLKKNEDSLGFIICKATEGITYTDPDFLNNWKIIKEKSFIRGAYHFYRTDDNPKSQAAHYLGTVSGFESTDFPPIVDFEAAGISKRQSIAEIQAGLITFLKEIEAKTNRSPIIYTDINTANKYLNDSVFGTYSLWISNIKAGDAPDLPIAWKGQPWLLWQRSYTYKIDGTADDFDVFNGNPSDLKRYISKSTTD